MPRHPPCVSPCVSYPLALSLSLSLAPCSSGKPRGLAPDARPLTLGRVSRRRRVRRHLLVVHLGHRQVLPVGVLVVPGVQEAVRDISHGASPSVSGLRWHAPPPHDRRLTGGCRRLPSASSAPRSRRQWAL